MKDSSNKKKLKITVSNLLNDEKDPQISQGNAIDSPFSFFLPSRPESMKFQKSKKKISSITVEDTPKEKKIRLTMPATTLSSRKPTEINKIYNGVIRDENYLDTLIDKLRKFSKEDFNSSNLPTKKIKTSREKRPKLKFLANTTSNKFLPLCSLSIKSFEPIVLSSSPVLKKRDFTWMKDQEVLSDSKASPIAKISLKNKQEIKINTNKIDFNQFLYSPNEKRTGHGSHNYNSVLKYFKSEQKEIKHISNKPNSPLFIKSFAKEV